MSCYRHRESAAWTEISEDEVVCLEVETGSYYGLRGIAKVIWEELQETRSDSELVAAIVEQYEVQETAAASDIRVFLDQLIQAGLVELVQPAA